jgi:hypothetical protein
VEKITQQPLLELGARIGRQQAFGVIANKCSAAQALALKQMKENRVYEQLGITWDEFCERHSGVCRRTADRIIGQYDEFGETYFRLSNLVNVSPDAYRALAPAIAGNSIDIGGEEVPIIPENAARIREFVRAQKRVDRPPKPAAPTVPQLALRLHHLILDLQHCAATHLSPKDRERLQQEIGHAVREWLEVGHRLDKL